MCTFGVVGPARTIPADPANPANEAPTRIPRPGTQPDGVHKLSLQNPENKHHNIYKQHHHCCI